MKNIQILIDASGSMGYMKGTKFEDQYLLPDKSTRTALVKKILINSIIPKLSFVEHIEISSFRNEVELSKNGKPLVVNNKVYDPPRHISHYVGVYHYDEITSKIEKIENPNTGGTPLFWSISMALNQKNIEEYNIIVLSDGDANDKENFDEEILKQIDVLKKKSKIYFIGIDQDEVAQKKAKNLADQTNGFYVNVDAVNYEESKFESLLFNFNTTIVSDGLEWFRKLKPEDFFEEKIVPLVIYNDKENNLDIKENIVEDNIIKIEEKGIQPEKQLVDESITKQVELNTKALGLIGTQLNSLINEISYLRKEKSNVEDEFISNEDEELNKIIGIKTEQILFEHLRSKWIDTIWLNENGEQGKPYDFEIPQNQNKYFIECKGSVGNSLEFFLTKNEWSFYLENRNFYRLYFLNNINSATPEIIKIEDLLSSMEKGELIPCSNVNRKVKADRILFQIIR